MTFNIWPSFVKTIFIFLAWRYWKKYCFRSVLEKLKGFLAKLWYVIVLCSRICNTDFFIVSTLCKYGLYWLCFVFFHQIKLSLGKDHPCQPLTAQIIPAHLAAVAAAAAIGNSFTHRTNHATNHAPTPALFQTQTLQAALLRPAPGPVRTSHPQVLFAPYWSVWPRWFGTAFCQRPNHVLHPDQAKESWQYLYSFYPSRILNIFVLWSDHFHISHLIVRINPRLKLNRIAVRRWFLPTRFLYSHWLQYTCILWHTETHDSYPDPNVDLHYTAIMYKTNPVNYAVSIFHDARHSLS